MKLALSILAVCLATASLNEGAFAQDTINQTGGGNASPRLASGTTTTLMPIGDSITWGLAIPATEAQGGYRCPLFWDLETHFGNNIQFEGYSQKLALPSGVVPETACSATQWDGYGGETIGEILTTVQNDRSVVNYKPKYITFMGGTNDIYYGIPQNTTSELTSLLNYFFDNDPGVTVVVSTIPPVYPGATGDPGRSQEAGWNAEVPGVNQQIISVVQHFQSAGYRIVLNDFYTAANANPAYYIGPDGVHPSVAGYNMLGDELYAKLAAFMGQSAPHP